MSDETPAPLKTLDLIQRAAQKQKNMFLSHVQARHVVGIFQNLTRQLNKMVDRVEELEKKKLYKAEASLLSPEDESFQEQLTEALDGLELPGI